MKHENVFNEIHFLLIDARRTTELYSCKIVSAIFASFLLSNLTKCFIIDSRNHSVVYDGKNTWDLSLGIMFKNYKYPDLDIPKPTFIPRFKHWFCEKNFNTFYNNKTLLEAKHNLIIKEIKNLGVIDGTKKEN